MRKQVDFDVRVFALGNGANDTWTRERVSAFVRDEYLIKGWEIFDVNTNQVFGGSIFYQITFLKYEDVALPEPTVKEKVAK